MTQQNGQKLKQTEEKTSMDFIRKVQSNKVFRFLSSVQLAVPLILIIAAVVAVGTLVESRYNALYAKLLVYGSWWFNGLLLLLGVVIFLVTLSRIPWKPRHVGFLITHFGMLTLLAGSVITKYYGLDGQLRIEEGQQSDEVVIYNENVLEVAGPRVFKKINVPRSLSGNPSLGGINEELDGFFKVQRYWPFVDPSSVEFGSSAPSGYFVRLKLKSQFFDQEQWLSTGGSPELQLGPALLQLLVDQNSSANPGSSKENSSEPQKEAQRETQSEAQGETRSGSSAPQIVISNWDKTKVIKIAHLRDLLKAPIKVDGAEIKVLAFYKSAVVSSNKIAEGGGEPNPAVELEISKGGKKYREILFAKFPEFSLMKDDSLGLRFTYKAGEMPGGTAMPSGSANATPEQTEATHPMPMPPSSSGASNLIQIHMSSKNTKVARLVLLKNGRQVLSRSVSVNQPVETPWMGMVITLSEMGFQKESDSNRETSEPRPMAPQPKVDFLPPSALEIRPIGDYPSTVMMEGSVKEIRVDDETYHVYYGPNTLRLPYAIKLEKFHKKDYLGTDMAMSFESDVRVLPEGLRYVISMNEPLKREGFTLYQASFEMQPGRTTASIFSVNRDPGRWVKYLGSLIMSLGIIIYVLQKSQFFKKEDA